MGARGKRPVPSIVPVSGITTDSKIEKLILKILLNKSSNFALETSAEKA